MRPCPKGSRETDLSWTFDHLCRRCQAVEGATSAGRDQPVALGGREKAGICNTSTTLPRGPLQRLSWMSVRATRRPKRRFTSGQHIKPCSNAGHRSRGKGPRTAVGLWSKLGLKRNCNTIPGRSVIRLAFFGDPIGRPGSGLSNHQGPAIRGEGHRCKTWESGDGGWSLNKTDAVYRRFRPGSHDLERSFAFQRGGDPLKEIGAVPKTREATERP